MSINNTYYCTKPQVLGIFNHKDIMEGLMKKKITLLLLILTVAMFFSCNKDKGSQAGNALLEGNGGPAAPAKPGEYGYILRVNSGFYVIDSDTGSEADKSRWAASLSLGERVITGENRRATYTNGAVQDYVEIRRENGSEGLALAVQTAVGGRLAVVVDEKANLFKSPKAIDVTGTILSRRTVVVYYPETENSGFVQIRAYDPINQIYIRQDTNSFIRATSLSRKDSDIQSSILMQTAEPLGNTGAEKVRKDALLESALLDYPDSAFSEEIQAVANPVSVNSIQTESANRPFMNVNDNNVNVRSLPDASSGRVVGSLSKGDEVTVSEQTAAEFTVGGQRARWYRITEPSEGWVFGAFLE